MTVRPTHTLFPHKPVPALPSEGLIGVIAPAGPGALDTSDALTPLEPKARAVLAAFRARAQYEIPQDNGFCIPYGFIADDGTPRHGITLGFTPLDNDKLLHRLSMGDDGEKAVELVPMLLARLIANPFPHLMSVDKFGPSKVQIGAVKGRIGGARYRPYLPDTFELSPIKRSTTKELKRYLFWEGAINTNRAELNLYSSLLTIQL